jgi:ATP-dependent DNA helicase RecG
VEKIVKRPDRAEADRFFNYPFGAIEEVLVNAVFHKSYRIQEPVEIRIYVDCIKVINYPGPEKTINMDELRTGKAIGRRYRNRRIGGFLKEIDLAERKSTGITKILRTLEKNGSPPPEFKTNDERDYMIVTIRQHEGFNTEESVNSDKTAINACGTVNGTVNKEAILSSLFEMPKITYDELSDKLKIPRRTIARIIKEFSEQGKIKRVGSDKSGYWEVKKL